MRRVRGRERVEKVKVNRECDRVEVFRKRVECSEVWRRLLVRME